MNPPTRVHILDLSVCISYSFKTIPKDMHPVIHREEKNL